MGIIQILILATQFGFEKNLNFLAIFRHFGHCAGGRPPLRGQFLYPERGQKHTFFDPLLPHRVHVVIE